MTAPAAGDKQTVRCPACNAALRVKTDPDGKRIQCPKCAHRWVPGAGSASVSPGQPAHGSAIVDPTVLAAHPAELPLPQVGSPTVSSPQVGAAKAAQPIQAGKRVKRAGESGAGGKEWIGRKLGQFEVKGFLGKGGMGAVLEGIDVVLRRAVAIKVLSPAVADDANALKRFLHEARSAALVTHPNLVSVFAVGEDQGVTYIAMELVRGHNCAERVRASGPMPVAAATRVITDAARGLAAAHAAGIIHRDIKPANLMIDAGGAVKVADFGLAKSNDTSEHGLTKTGEVVGTPSYMSSEQCRGDKLDTRSDIYSLGATYYFLLTGRPPFTAENQTGVLFKHVYEPVPDPRKLRPDLPDACRRIIHKAMAKSADERYQTADEMVEDLNQVESPLGQSPLGDMLAALDDRTDAHRSLAVSRIGPGPSAVTRVGAPGPRRGGNANFSVARIALGVAVCLPVCLIAIWLMVGRNKPPEEGPPPDLGKAVVRQFREGEKLDLFSGRPTTMLDLKPAWRIEEGTLTFDPGHTNPADNYVGVNVNPMADFRMRLQVKWESVNDPNEATLEIHYRSRQDQKRGYRLVYKPSPGRGIGKEFGPLLAYDKGDEFNYIPLSHSPETGRWDEVTLEVQEGRHAVKVAGIEVLSVDGDDSNTRPFNDRTPGRFFLRAAAGRVAVKDWKLTLGAPD